MNTELNLYGKVYTFAFNLQTARFFQKFYKQETGDASMTLQKALNQKNLEEDLNLLVCLLGAAIKDSKGMPVGIDFVDKLDLETDLTYIMHKIEEIAPQK